MINLAFGIKGMDCPMVKWYVHEVCIGLLTHTLDDIHLFRKQRLVGLFRSSPKYVSDAVYFIVSDHIFQYMLATVSNCMIWPASLQGRTNPLLPIRHESHNSGFINPNMLK